MELIRQNIKEVWSVIDNWMNNEEKLISSEKSVVFNFAWEFNRNFASNILHLDFETSLFDDFSDGQFLDLFMEYQLLEKVYRIGIEFKYPNKKENNSNQTVTRQKIINDVKRLNWLVANDKIDLGVFLCVTNESSYVHHGKFKIATQFLTHQGMSYQTGSYLPHNDIFLEQVVALNDIFFDWSNVSLVRNKHRIAGRKFSFLKPIFISVGSGSGVTDPGS